MFGLPIYVRRYVRPIKAMFFLKNFPVFKYPYQSQIRKILESIPKGLVNVEAGWKLVFSKSHDIFFNNLIHQKHLIQRLQVI